MMNIKEAGHEVDDGLQMKVSHQEENEEAG